ncbi:MAG: hypothetical protein N2378_19180 [Chloroflexaceae bacterium]|nr:hypothetical protein [Chloroflexaceae bacterium]
MNETLRARLLAAGPPLRDLAAGRIGPALPVAWTAALRLTRAERDRLVIFDPTVAPLIRPLSDAEDLAPWHLGATGRWIIAVPASRAADLPARHPRLAQHLATLPTPPDAGSTSPWWLLPAGQERPPEAPRIIVSGSMVAWDEATGPVGGAATVIAAADPYWLAVLASAPGRALLSAGVAVEDMPVPEAPGPARANLAGLALNAATLAARRDELERAVTRRLVADFGPPGVQPGPRLRRWWELSFAELHTAVNEELHNDIPERYRPTWAEIHADERATHADATARLADLQRAIDAQVAALFGVEVGEL